MAKIIIDGQEVTCRDGIPVLQAALEAGFDVPHFCYHPGLSVAASCRLCLMEVKVPDPKTGQMVWSSKLIPSCQTQVRDGMEVRFNSERVRAARRQVLEYFLLNHPLDCPVCDQAGECLLQDYTFRFGPPVSRTVELKRVNWKKDIGSRTILYQDRCVLCTRCVRFTREIAGTNELCVVLRGSRAEIDVFQGVPLENKLQGCVVDLCPVGAMLDKDFLFKKRVWFLQSTESVCPGCSTGCTIRVDHDSERVWRVRPRYNPRVNHWWMCDDGRFGWKYVDRPDRLVQPTLSGDGSRRSIDWQELPSVIRTRLDRLRRGSADKPFAVMLSPMMACEETWLLVGFVRSLWPQAVLAMGPVPVVGDDEVFPVGADRGEARFVVSAEKCPNRRGIELILDAFGPPVCSFEEFVRRAREDGFAGAWIVGGYPDNWITESLLKAAESLSLLIAQDMFSNALTDRADVALPACPWVERSGCFVNGAGLVQPFHKVVNPPAGCLSDGEYLCMIAGRDGPYEPARLRLEMAERIELMRTVYEPPPEPRWAH